MKAILAAALIALPAAATAGDARDLAGVYMYTVEGYTGRMTVAGGTDGYTVRAATAAPGGFTCGLKLDDLAFNQGRATVRHPDLPADMVCTVTFEVLGDGGLSLATDGCHSYLCGANGWIDGLFLPVRSKIPIGGSQPSSD